MNTATNKATETTTRTVTVCAMVVVDSTAKATSWNDRPCALRVVSPKTGATRTAPYSRLPAGWASRMLSAQLADVGVYGGNVEFSVAMTIAELQAFAAVAA